jgi:DNA-binding IscR family transcriptional regulator
MVRPIWADVQTLVRNKLSSVTLKDCARQNHQSPAPQPELAEKDRG